MEPFMHTFSIMSAHPKSAKAVTTPNNRPERIRDQRCSQSRNNSRNHTGPQSATRHIPPPRKQNAKFPITALFALVFHIRNRFKVFPLIGFLACMDVSSSRVCRNLRDKFSKVEQAALELATSSATTADALCNAS